MTTQVTKIHEEQLNESYIKQSEKNINNGVAALDSNSKINFSVLPTNITESINDASTSQKGKVQLSNSYTGTSTTLATTEKALSDGLYQVRTYVTTTILFIVGTGTDTDTIKYISAGVSNLNCSSVWPTSTLYGISLYRNGLYKLVATDWAYNSNTKIVFLSDSTVAGDKIVVVFDAVINGESISVISYSRAEIDNMLSYKANINSPTLTGTPLAPTAAVSTNTQQIATTAYVQSEFNNYIGKRKIVVSNTTPVGMYTEGDLWFETV